MIALLVDDHPLARRGLATIVRQAFRVERIVEADTAEYALRAARMFSPELILLDLRMPGVPEPSVLCSQLHLAAPNARIAVVTAFEDSAELMRCLAAGADGCLLKDASVSSLEDALRAIVVGRRVIDPRIAQSLATAHVDTLRGSVPEASLTRREREVLELLAEGCSNRLIGERLFLAETTVKGYVSQLLEKLGVSSRLQAVIRATEQGLL